MLSAQIRETFLNFFASKDHKIVPSAPIVVKDDPTLMFTNAGMNQFKDYFLGNRTAEYPRIADTQKCLRVSGKHNDLEEVGLDTYHHTMFEMLGNWSFGDYFKEEAISWAWELLTEVYKMDKSRLYVTYFEGDVAENLEADEETRQIWSRFVSADRILKGNKKDNFWEMGATGPCGPCTEIHVDIRDDAERALVDGKTLVNASHPHVIEIWNNVFIQFNRSANGSLSVLPAKHVDTGMGFERLCMVLQGKKSNYDTDVFTPLIATVEAISGIQYQYSDSKQDVAMRVIADHIRAVTFTIADGQLPSNTGAGYVIRRILRRAVRYGYSYLDLKEPFFHKLVVVVAKQFEHVFTNVLSQLDLVEKVIREEEATFLNTLGGGLKKFAAISNISGKEIGGREAFELYDTFGFPIDLTRLLAAEQGLTIDEAGFETELKKQKERSKKDAAVNQEDWVQLVEDEEEEFVGYDFTEANVHLVRYRKVVAKEKEQYQLVFNYTPFYAEGGGQVGDTGYLIADDEKVRITDTKKENNLIIHYSDELPKNLNGSFKAVVDNTKRIYTERNHTATHLLHEALRSVLGTHVQQKGSLVNEDYLRFDFSHFAKVSDEELVRIESIVNENILHNFPLDERRHVPMNEAKNMGAMALFGEKYGDVVRVIRFGNSVELCGGTHVKATGNIGLFKIVSESAVAAGIRRIEAVTGMGALSHINGKLEQLEKISVLSRNTRDIVKGIEALVTENNDLRKELERLQNQQAGQLKETLKGQVQSINGIHFLAVTVPLNAAEAIKNLAFNLRQEVENLFLVLGAEMDGKAHLTVMLDDQLVKDMGLNASNIVRELAREIEGGGGGQPFYATAGGKKPQGLAKAMAKAQEMVASMQQA
ncbi:MAG: alanine--tRNA ligase [Chitinophagales bacterium]|nr:alanine--tRNA ligase [Chitinophagales bacterium]